MAIKFKIKKAAYDKLDPLLQGEYIAGENDGEYVLDVSDLPQGEDVGPVKRALDSERNAHKATKTALSETKAKLEAMPDVDALTATHNAEVKKYKDFTEKSLGDGAALALASKISTVPGLMAKAIRERLVVDMTGDEPVTKVKGADGKISDMTIEKLGEEFVANKEYASIVLASKGSGGGTPPGPTIKPLGGGMPPKDGEQSQTVDLSREKPSDLAARITEKRAAREAAAQQQQA